MLLKRLTEASGISGNEWEVRNLIINEIKDHVDDLKIDKLGNVIAFKKGKEIPKKLMITAHMDEVGLMIIDVDDKGYIKFTTVGGIDKRILVSKPVLVGDKKIPGVIGSKPIHLQMKEERDKAIEVDNLYIDIGVDSKEEALKYVKIGDYITFDSRYIEFGDNLIKAKALDNRVGCSLLIELIKEVEDISFYGVFTVMEEVGLKGAGPAAYSVDPDICIVLEGTLCYDVPEIDSHFIPTRLNDGPAISLIDKTTLFNKALREKIVEIAKLNDIPYQYRKSSMGGNDSGKIHTTKEGAITATISVPCRNIHSPTSVMSRKDYENTLKLLKAILCEYKKGEFTSGI
ncbi:MAG: M42 family metallopeptidase [Tissierellia bacterium]|nr:M42 family metallopeptidase [Tissierellia bacterium]